MRYVPRLLRLAAHLCLSGLAFVLFTLYQRGGILVFTHHADLDGSGRDVQMGPLVDELRRGESPLIEVTLVSLSGGLLHNLFVKRRLFLSHAALLAAARVVAWLPGFDRERARRFVGRACLRALRPSAVFLVDESGSGQLLVRAARSLRIPTLGIQHGDFQRGNPQYGPVLAPALAPVPVDVLCLWSPWFRRRLLALSKTYDEHNTRVVGRMRYAEPRPAPAARPADSPLRVLLVSQPHPGFRAQVEPFLEALRADAGVRLVIRPHPAESPPRWPALELTRAPLARAIGEADVVIGVDSSALLEALWWHKQAVRLGSVAPGAATHDDVLQRCAAPEELSGVCRVLMQNEGAVDELRARVWGDADGCPVEAILDVARERRIALRSAA